MTTEHDIEKQELPTDQPEAQSAEPESVEQSPVDKNEPEENLYFWSEPGVCG